MKTHRVENRGEGAMPFEVGGHEAYAVRLLPGERMADYFVRFEGLDCLEAFGMDERGILSLPKGASSWMRGACAARPSSSASIPWCWKTCRGGR